MTWKGGYPTPTRWRRIWSFCLSLIPTTHEKGRIWK